MINNFNVIDNFIQFEEGTFYKFELLVRNTDGEKENELGLVYHPMKGLQDG